MNDDSGGWISGAMSTYPEVSHGRFSTPHRVFVDLAAVTAYDGGPLVTASLARQRAVGTCEICGARVTTDDFPVSGWRHMSAGEAEEYANTRAEADEAKSAPAE